MKDLQGRKVSLWDDFKVQPLAFFRKNNLRVRIIPQTYTLNLFLRGGVDVASAMWYNEYHTIINAGIDPDELSVFFLKDEGLNLPEDGLYALEKTVKNDPDLAAEFVAASLEGWEYAFTHPDEALDIIMRYMRAAKIPANRMHQKWMLARMLNVSWSRVHSEAHHIEHTISDEIEARMIQEVLRNHGIESTINAESAREKFQAGAQLIQLYTGFIYRGPGLLHEIMAQL